MISSKYRTLYSQPVEEKALKKPFQKPVAFADKEANGAREWRGSQTCEDDRHNAGHGQL